MCSTIMVFVILWQFCRVIVACIGYGVFGYGAGYPGFLEIVKTAGVYSLQIYNYLSQIQRKTKHFF